VERVINTTQATERRRLRYSADEDKPKEPDTECIRRDRWIINVRYRCTDFREGTIFVGVVQFRVYPKPERVSMMSVMYHARQLTRSHLKSRFSSNLDSTEESLVPLEADFGMLSRRGNA
jgi:hypothetical protein